MSFNPGIKFDTVKWAIKISDSLGIVAGDAYEDYMGLINKVFEEGRREGRMEAVVDNAIDLDSGLESIEGIVKELRAKMEQK